MLRSQPEIPRPGHPPPAGYRTIRVDDESLRIPNSVEQRPHAVDHLRCRTRNLRSHQHSHRASLILVAVNVPCRSSHTYRRPERAPVRSTRRRQERRSSATSLRVYSGALAHSGALTLQPTAQWDPSEAIEHQRAMNRETWRQLIARGVTEDTELVLDFVYLADGGSDADALVAFLRSETDYDLRSSDAGVEGSTRATTVTLAVLDEWVEWMTLAGWENGRCRFDGWGTGHRADARRLRVSSGTLIWSAACQRAQGLFAPLCCGVGFGGGSASAVVDVCVATHMRGLVPHDRVCEMRSGAVLWRRAWPVGAAHSVLSGRSSRRCAGALSSPSRCWWRLLHRRERPAVSGELARDGDHDDRAGLASGLERVPASVQPAGAAVRLGSHGEGLARASAFQRDAQTRRRGGGARRPRSAAGARASCRPW